MINVAIIVIGDEILLGRVTDTNSGFIARAIDAIGANVTGIRAVPDKEDAIRSAIENAFVNADIVFTTGGLGPTKDDITKKVLLDTFGGILVKNTDVVENIKKIFVRKNLELNRLTLDQTLVPSSCQVIQNKFGTAPIMVFQREGKFLFAMPGVPNETEGMFPEVMRYVENRFNKDLDTNHFTVTVTGLSESALAEWLEEFENRLPSGYKLAYLPDSPIIKLRLDAHDSSDSFQTHVEALCRRLEENESVTMLGTGEKSLAETVVERLKEKGLTMSTAESCTGGNVAHLITSVAGSSDIFNGGIVSYANSAKINVLDVGVETIQLNGAVSEQVVRQMVDGAARVLSTDCAIATSGIAGPSGGTPEKPVGTVWIAVKTPRGTTARVFRFPGKRSQVIDRASATALIMLLRQLD